MSLTDPRNPLLPARLTTFLDAASPPSPPTWVVSRGGGFFKSMPSRWARSGEAAGLFGRPGSRGGSRDLKGWRSVAFGVEEFSRVLG